MKLKDIQKGDILILKAKSRKGKNRIHQHGNTWTVQDKVVRGHWGNLLLRSKNKTFRDSPTKMNFDTRWIWAINDSDFEIVKVVQRGRRPKERLQNSASAQREAAAQRLQNRRRPPTEK